jgi:alcohol dehydrogenase class IV
MTSSFGAVGVLRLPDHIQVGLGARHSLLPAVLSLGRRVFVVVDPFLATTSDFAEIMKELRSAGIEVTTYTSVVPELPLHSVDSAAEAARGVTPEVIIGYGGGSALDLAKLVALLLTFAGPLSKYYGENRIPGPVLPIIAVPTTAGTGSEVTPVAVISDPQRELKVGISDASLIPRFAIVDPELTIGAPAAVTAHSGIDALVHAIEALTAGERQPEWSETLPVFVGRNRLSSILAWEAIRAIGASLTTAVAEPSNLQAREQMAWGSVLAGMAFGSAGTHLSHALQYPIGALTKTPHGLGTGMMLPYVLQASRDASEPELTRVADALGVERDSAGSSAQAAIDRVAEIVAEIGVPLSLAEIGITQDQLPRIAELALGVTRLAGNASIPATPELLASILDAAWRGDRDLLA